MNAEITPEQLAALIPEGFLTVRSGDTVTLFVAPLDYGVPDPADFLAKALLRVAPEIKWMVVEGTGMTGVIHVARDDRDAPSPRVPAGDADTGS